MFLRQDEDENIDAQPTPTPHENLPQSSHTQEQQHITTEEKKPQLYPISKERGPRTTEDLDPQQTATSQEKKLLEPPSKQEDGERHQSPLPKHLSLSLGISCDDIMSLSLGISCYDIMPKKTDEVTFLALYSISEIREE